MKILVESIANVSKEPKNVGELNRTGSLKIRGVSASESDIKVTRFKKSVE